MSTPAYSHIIVLYNLYNHSKNIEGFYPKILFQGGHMIDPVKIMLSLIIMKRNTIQKTNLSQGVNPS